MDRFNARSKKPRRKAKKNAPPPTDDMAVDDDGIRIIGDDGNYLDWCDYVQQFDVVITTYTILRSEIHVARPAPERLRREDASYSSVKALRSPLVMVEWKRVVMDEVQMVGGGHAA
jgi:E3 ubiquitin-protein ligase SHPRH